MDSVNFLKAFRSRWTSLPGGAKMLIFVAVLFGAWGSCNTGFWAIRDSYLGRELPRREQVLRSFLARPCNYRETLGGELKSFRIVQNYSDGFATYTYFVCQGTINQARVEFQARVQGEKVFVSPPTEPR